MYFNGDAAAATAAGCGYPFKGTVTICDEKMILHTKLIVYCPCENVNKIH